MTTTRLMLVTLVAACGSTTPDSPTTDASGATDGSPSSTPSRCAVAGTQITCSSHSLVIGGRTVTYELPNATAPAAGWPLVVFYQGSFIPGSRAFSASTSDSFGQFELTSTIKALLDRGYAVVAPDAQSNGSLYWQTNVPPYATNWTGCDDDVFIVQLIAAATAGTFGPLDPTRRYAMGISSGGFMTSRMAVSYAGKFRALAVASGSYATCGATCTVPVLPADHPPTLFLHGDQDPTVPMSSMTPYRDKLAAEGFVVKTVIHPGAGHEWLPEGKTAIPDWFDAH
ncbi:MAG: dienelactone hydrolase family protein [Myxococcales bacterium]|nr:dienelactone hydrolase family protein [Myxococcales bacterium]